MRFEMRDHSLQFVQFLAGYANLVVHDLSLDLELELLDILDDFPRVVGLDTGMQSQGFSDRVVRCVLELATSQRTDMNAALGHLFLDDLDHRLELTLVIGQYGQCVVFLVELDGSMRSLEIEPYRDFMLRLNDGVVHLG